MAEVLLTSEMFIKSVSSISDNLSGKYILPALREAQEINLKSILGDSLLSKAKALVKTGDIDQEENAVYKSMLGKVQYYLAYMTIAEVMNKVAFKVGNFGVSRTTDEQMQYASADEVDKQIYYYQSKADFYCMELQQWLLDYKAQLPELTENQCRKIGANLTSSATCGVFLGGARGKRIRRC